MRITITLKENPPRYIELETNPTNGKLGYESRNLAKCEAEQRTSPKMQPEIYSEKFMQNNLRVDRTEFFSVSFVLSPDSVAQVN